MQQVVAEASAIGRLRFSEKAGYGMGDAASCLYWQTFSAFLLLFYTDVYGLPAAIAGAMVAFTRVGDAFIDPIMGMVADRTRSHWGRFRPYLVWMSVPLAVAGVAAFSTPSFGPTGKIVYASVTCTFLMLTYTAVNIPYGALLGVITSDPLDRTSLASYKYVFAFAATLLAQAIGPHLAGSIGWQATMGLFGLTAVLLFYGAFSLTGERIQPPSGQRTSFSRDLGDLAANPPWALLSIIGVCTLISASVRFAATFYYFKYYVGSQVLTVLGRSYECDTKILLTLFTVVTYGGCVLGVMSTKFLVAFLGKKYTYLFSMLVTTLVTASYFVWAPGQLKLIFGLQFFGQLLGAPSLAVIWAMYADIADYSEWKHGRRATGLVFSASSMAQKVGWAAGSALAGWLLAHYGFMAGQPQSDAARSGIVMLFSVIPAVPALAATVLVLFYSLDEKRMHMIQESLADRRGKISVGMPESAMLTAPQ